MYFRTIADCARNERGDGQVSYLLLSGQEDFSTRQMTVTWVEASPGSEQGLHEHPESEQVYVVVKGFGRMRVGDELRDVIDGTLIFIPRGTPHSIRNIGTDPLLYVSATTPPFPAVIEGATWRPA